jgi:hypothetical protein
MWNVLWWEPCQWARNVLFLLLFNAVLGSTPSLHLQDCTATQATDIPRGSLIKLSKKLRLIIRLPLY